jgi:hypothetical protein
VAYALKDVELTLEGNLDDNGRAWGILEEDNHQRLMRIGDFRINSRFSNGLLEH